jgi:TRAP-type uncharacterized transport system substrate-binding protein
MHKWCSGLLVLAAIAVAPCASMAAQQSDFKLSPSEWQMRQKTNEGVIRIIADDVDSTSFRAVTEVSSVLNGLEGLRVIPVVGRGSVSNVNDLLFLKEIDLAVVQQDVLDQLKSTRAIPALERRINYLTKLYNEEVHVLARKEFQDISALANRKVSFGPVAGGAAITATALFDKLRIPVEVSNDDADVALMKLKSGEIDAMVYVDGKPVRLFEQLAEKDGVHFLAVPYDRSLYRAYTPSSLTSTDYPNLIGPGEKLETPAVGAILTVFNWKEDTTRFKAIARFTDFFFARAHLLAKAPRHPKWSEMNLSARIANWDRFRAADEALPRLAAISPDACTEPELRAAIQTFLKDTKVALPRTNTLSEQDTSELTEKFKAWLKANPQYQ